MLPRSFNAEGFLPEDYEVTFTEIRDSLLIHGPQPKQPSWNESRRRWLLDNLEILIKQLWAVGIEQIYINGSFVTSKDIPGDIDACFQCDYNDLRSGRLAKELNASAPKKIWTWLFENRVAVPGYPKLHLPMWAEYRVEIYPFGPDWPAGVFIDNALVPFPEAFRRVKNSDRRKGIIILKKGTGE